MKPDPPFAALKEEPQEIAKGSRGPIENKAIQHEAPKGQLKAARQAEFNLLGELLNDRMQMASAVKALEKQVGEIGDALERANGLLEHEQRKSEELRQQLREQAEQSMARNQKSQAHDELFGALLSNRLNISKADQTLQDKLTEQNFEMEKLRCELDKARAMLVHEQAATQDLRFQLEECQAEVKRMLLPEAEKVMQPEVPMKSQEATMELLGALLEHTSRTSGKQESWEQQIETLTLEVKDLRGKMQMAEAIALNSQQATEKLREQLRKEEERRLEAGHLNSFQAAWYMNDYAQRRVCEAYSSVLLHQLKIRYPYIASHLHMLAQKALGEAQILQGSSSEAYAFSRS